MLDFEARNKLVVSYLPMVHTVMRSKRVNWEIYEDCVSAGYEGLVEAATQYESTEKREAFSSYAVEWVEHAIQAEKAYLSYPLRVSQQVRQMAKRLEEYQHQQFCERGEYPSRMQCYHDFKISPRKQRNIELSQFTIIPLPTPIEEGHGVPEELLIEDELPEEESDFLQRVWYCLRKESQELRVVFYLHGGLLTGDQVAFRTIAAQLVQYGYRLSIKKVERLWQTALEILRANLDREGEVMVN